MDLPGRAEPLDVLPVKSGSGLKADEQSPVEFFIAADKKGRSKKEVRNGNSQKRIYIINKMIGAIMYRTLPSNERACLATQVSTG